MKKTLRGERRCRAVMYGKGDAYLAGGVESMQGLLSLNTVANSNAGRKLLIGEAGVAACKQ